MFMGAEIGMLIVETIAKIRRLFFVQGKPIKAICRELRLSRKVVRKVLRSKATEFHYERETQPLPKIGPWIDRLDQLLLAARLKYVSPRLRESSAGDRRQGSGAGESDLDLDRRKIRDRLAELKGQLEDIQRDNDQRRSARSDQ
jgi:hypothetical protein